MIFLGPLFQREQETTIISLTPSGSIQNQVNTFEWNVIEGLYENGVNDLQIINVLPVGTYPKNYKKLVLPDRKWGENNIEVGCINLPFIKQFGRCRRIKRLVNHASQKEILIYSAYLPFLKAVYKLPRDKHVTLIVTDLPEYYDLAKTSPLKAFFRKRNNRKIYRCLERVDRYVLLTEQMKERLPVGGKKCVVVEGLIGKAKEIPDYRPKDRFVITYGGALNAQFGIEKLINAVLALNNPKIELHLFGNGDLVEKIRQVSNSFPNIVFHGFVPKSEMEEFFSKTHLLVNPRGSEGEYTKYSFPSKTMEYLLSGIPFLGYRLDGVPDEYYDYISVIQGDSVTDLLNAINAICSNYAEYEEKAKRGRRFVIENKNRTAQARKIIELMSC